MDKTQVIKYVPHWAVLTRNFLHYFLLKNIFPCKIIDEHNFLKKADEDAKKGTGILVAYNHFSLRDGLELVRFISINNPVLKKRNIINPLSFHQYSKFLAFLTGTFDVKLYPVVNNDTLSKKKYAHLNKNKGMPEFIQAGSETLKGGGIVMIATNAGRREHLEISDPQKPIGYFILNMDQKKIKDYKIMIVALGIEGEKNYSKKNVGGFNAHKIYIMNVVNYLTLDKLMNLKEINGKISAVDYYIREQLAKGVQKEYLPQT